MFALSLVIVFIQNMKNANYLYSMGVKTARKFSAYKKLEYMKWMSNSELWYTLTIIELYPHLSLNIFSTVYSFITSNIILTVTTPPFLGSQLDLVVTLLMSVNRPDVCNISVFKSWVE